MAIYNLQGVQPITGLTNCDFVTSPRHLTFSADANTISISLNLWIWDGPITTPLAFAGTPTQPLIGTRISATDNYITFEVGEILQSYINPTMQYGADSSIMSSEGVYWQWTAVEEKNVVANVIYTGSTRYATLGYHWNYEGEAAGFSYNRGSFGFPDSNIPIYQDKHIVYYKPKINVSGATNSNAMVVRDVQVVEYLNTVCVKEPWTIVYLNKFGLFEYFTPTGKVSVSSKIDRDDYKRGYRNPRASDPKLVRTTNQYNINSIQSYVMNTGILKEKMGEMVEEIEHSPMVYLIQYLGSSGQIPLTVDSTIITVDSTAYTADQTHIGTLYNNYRQIPVNCTSQNFDRKTLINDKVRISYPLTFEESNSKINDLR
jgi:hypothetical protein